jgi:hypothetical protein
MDPLQLIGNDALRRAIQRNLASFPAQVPSFARHRQRDLQIRIAQLYFVRGWPITRITARYGINKAVIVRLIQGWRIRAIGAGYIRDIRPDPMGPLMETFDSVRP